MSDSELLLVFIFYGTFLGAMFIIIGSLICRSILYLGERWFDWLEKVQRK
jgi:ABC-type lipoprotein release transport system permease subunit